jgi:hypothetical protein
LLTVIQRSSGDLKLNPHLHVVALDGVYLARPDGLPVFRALGRLKTDEVADVVQITKARVLKALERRGVVRVRPEALEVDGSGSTTTYPAVYLWTQDSTTVNTTPVWEDLDIPTVIQRWRRSAVPRRHVVVRAPSGGEHGWEARSKARPRASSPRRARDGLWPRLCKSLTTGPL